MLFRVRALAVGGLVLAVGCGKSERPVPKGKIEGIQVTGRIEGHAAGAAVGAVSFVPVDDAGNDKPGQPSPGGTVEADGTFKATVPAGKYRIYYVDATGQKTPRQVVTVGEQSKQFVVKAAEAESE